MFNKHIEKEKKMNLKLHILFTTSLKFSSFTFARLATSRYFNFLMNDVAYISFAILINQGFQ